ncbi:hypothetical protein AGMMS49959_12020 [Planctomycetales bacterium]|nr:hypothetical protein AGMMS49959_12020 [Planctomycetales bacterium]
MAAWRRAIVRNKHNVAKHWETTLKPVNQARVFADAAAGKPSFHAKAMTKFTANSPQKEPIAIGKRARERGIFNSPFTIKN